MFEKGFKNRTSSLLPDRNDEYVNMIVETDNMIGNEEELLICNNKIVK